MEWMKALLLENIHPDAKAALAHAGIEVDARAGSLAGPALTEALAGATIVGIRSNTKLTADVLASAPDLVAIGAFCIGTNQIDLQAAGRRGVAVFNAPYSNTRSVVELVIAEIIALSRHLSDKTAQMHAGVWDKSATGSHEVRGRTLGIVGYGNIGSQLSVIAEALGMSVIYYDISDKLALGNAKRADTLEQLLAAADFVTLHVDGRPGNAGFFGTEQFAAMRPGAYFLNLSRGFVVDINALADAVKHGRVAGAAIDTYPTEPNNGSPFVSPLQGLPNVILTPHVGGSTEEAQKDIGNYVAGKLIDYITTGSSIMSVNLPNVAAPEPQGRRVAHIHNNVPGVLAALNAALSAHQANIAFQSLATRGDIGYAITDVTTAEPGLVTALTAMPETIRVRLLTA